MNDALKPLAAKDGDPIFEAAWQAEVLGVADLLVQQGLFTATDWADALGNAVRAHPDTTEGYYKSVLAALEHLLAENGVPTEALDQMQEDWKAAYERTPHGQPVELYSKE